MAIQGNSNLHAEFRELYHSKINLPGTGDVSVKLATKMLGTHKVGRLWLNFKQRIKRGPKLRKQQAAQVVKKAITTHGARPILLYKTFTSINNKEGMLGFIKKEPKLAKEIYRMAKVISKLPPLQKFAIPCFVESANKYMKFFKEARQEIELEQMGINLKKMDL